MPFDLVRRLYLGMLKFSFFEKQSFRYDNDDEKSKTKQSFLKTIVFFKKFVF